MPFTSPRRLATAALMGAAATLSAVPYTAAFVAPTQSTLHQRTSASALSMADDKVPFEYMIDLPGEGLSAQMKFPSIVDGPSQMIEVRYKVPFGLAVEPQGGLATCTTDGAGGEKVGDILRYTSQWTLGLPRGDGVITTAMSFSGGISWQISMFDVARATRWEDVVEALVSNESSRTDEVVLLFERPLPEETE